MSRVASRFLVVVMATLLATGWVTARPLPVSAETSELFFSEYIEGTSNNKALEIYNGTGAPINLAAGAYNIQMFFNGSATATLTINLTGTLLADGDVYVVAQASANAAILAQADQTSSAGWFNGDDAVVLRKGTTIIDSLGQIGLDPGTEWGTGLASTADNTLGRKSTVCGGDTNSGDVFDPAVQWDGFATDTFTGLGSHTADCGDVTPGLSINNVSQSEGNSGTTTFTFSVSLSAAAGAGGVTFDIATADDSALVADNDYVANSLTGQSIPEGSSGPYNFAVQVNGDTTTEVDQAFFVNVTNVTGATVTDGQGVGTIINDDSCGLSFTPIYDIQGSGATIPAGKIGTQTTEGIVVGDYEGSTGLQGFYIQDATGDGDSATSDGMFVFTGSSNLVLAGQLVRVTGFARERFDQTAMNGSNSNSSPVPAANIVNCGAGSVTATDVTMPFVDLVFPERYEGMLVRFTQPLVISEYFNYERFGELVLALPLEGETRPFTGTAIDEPGAAANARTLANGLRRVTLDDGLGIQNPANVRHPNGGTFALNNKFRGGDTVTNATGVLGQDFGLYRIQPTGPATYTSVNPRPVGLPDVDGGLTVAAMNTLNFFVTLDYPSGNPLDNKCGPLQNMECRGADFAADPPLDPIVDDEFTRQRDKLLIALAGLDADVLGLNEIENTAGIDPLASIIAGLNAMPDVGPYAAIDTGAIGTDAIKVGLIYRPGVVTPVGSFQVLDSTDDPRFVDTRSRPALAQTFEEIATGARFTVVVNHLKSKGDSGLAGTTSNPGICTDADPANDVPDCDQLDGQGYWNHTRTQAAEALVDWIATDPTGAGDPDFLIVGDLNSYAKEDPIDAIKVGPDDAANTGDDWTNLIEQYVRTYAYSFVFDGQSGYLDHALANASIVGQVVDANEWHINADEPDILDYDVSFKPEAQDRLYEVNQFRTSDHDPVLVGLNLVNEAPTIVVTAGNSCNTSTSGGSFTLVVDDNEVAAGSLTVSLTGNTNITLVPNGDVVLGGAGANRTVAITTASGVIGTAVLTLGVNDGFQTSTTTITVRVGGSANDAFIGSGGADLLVGGQGADNLSGLGGADVLCGGQGIDMLFGGDGADTLDGGQGSDILSGGEGTDRLTGGQGSDSLSGDGGDDTLTGGAGADAFSGGAGTDVNTDLTPSQGDTWDGT